MTARPHVTQTWSRRFMFEPLYPQDRPRLVVPAPFLGVALQRGAGNNGPVSAVTACSFLNGPGVRCGMGWSSAWPERVIGVAGPLADLAALIPLGLPGVPGPLQLRG
jgi:hypothetical protein